MSRLALNVTVVGGLALTLCAGRGVAAEPVDFAHQIVPLVRERCGQCHTGDKKKGGYSMNTRASLIAGGESGTVVTPGKSGDSELVRRIISTDKDERMPPEGAPLSDTEVSLIKRWIDSNVPWEEGFVFRPPTYEPPLLRRRVELPLVTGGHNNPVDRLIDAYFQAHALARPQPVGDAERLRRLSLDLTGLLPTREQLQAFLADSRRDKREQLVRELLADDVAYAEHWLTFWNDLLRNDYAGTGFITGGRKQITGWLYRSLVENKPYDQFVRELIAPQPEAVGFIQGIRWRGTVSASQSQEVQFAQNISQAFLGINMKCASCHDSFIDHWKLSEAYGLAAIYATEPLAIHRCDKPTGMTAKAAWIFPELGQIEAEAPQPERLKQLAALMTHRDNGRFTRTIVNRLWHRLMGRGIVHPVDAMHTQPWSADLLDYLAVDFADHGYDLKHTLELVCTSQIYQARTPALIDETDNDDYVFHGPIARRMSAEQFVDAVWQLTGAAPASPDAQVVRAQLKENGDGGQAPPSQASWIWTDGDFKRSAVGQAATFRAKLSLSQSPARAVAVATCDNEYRLIVNGQTVNADDNWATVELMALPQLKKGDNEILIAAKNGGKAPNAAGLIFEARVRFADETEQSIASGSDWQWTSSQPDARGKFREDPMDWKPAVAIDPTPAWKSRLQPQLTALLHQGSAGPLRMVRAALMKSDTLMRALGRPNRDQIVSMRPSELTTLEAIDLANGPTLAAAIERGAKLWQPAAGEKTADVVQRLYIAALSREPTADELAAAIEMLGSQPASDAIQDLLWSILMLPEFQLVR